MLAGKIRQIIIKIAFCRESLIIVLNILFCKFYQKAMRLVCHIIGIQQ